MPHHVSKAKFAELVEQAAHALPKQFADAVNEVPIEIRERPSRRMLRSLGLEEDELLLGLYHGRPRTERSVEDSGRLPDVIYIFQEDVELVSESEADLIEQVRTTVLHELGHHFGMSEDDLDALGYG
jgi:predicted Zn-dependent protease with MMP-like domain